MTIIFFILASLESFALGTYLVMQGSRDLGAAIANLSPSRLATSAMVFLVAVVFLVLAILAFQRRCKGRELFSGVLVSGKKLLVLFSFSIFLMIIMFFLLTRPPSFGGDYRLVISRLEPVFVWVLLMSAEAAFFIANWFCAYFIINQKRSLAEARKELLPVFVLFFAMVIAKWIFVSSASYGPGVGDEMKYFDMAESMNRGFFSIAQTHVAPPLYSLAILPAIVFGEYTFDLIKLINAIVSTAIVFPTYFISRGFLDQKKSLIVTIIACLNPFHLVFPRRILSENLYYPIFLWTMYFVLKKPFKKNAGLLWDVFTGIALGLLYLTRYISLVAIPMFLAAWWIKPFDKNDSLMKPTGRKIARFIMIALIAALVFSPWIIHAIREGVPIKMALGFVITATTNAEQLTTPRFFIWLVLYICYMVIMIAPLLPLLLKAVTSIKWSDWRKAYGRWVFQITAVMAAFLVAATRHSWRATYNAGIPRILMGRYVLFLAVPFLILFFITLDKAQHDKTNQNVKKDIWLLLISSSLVLLAYFVIVQPSIINVETYFARLETSADVFYVNILGIAFLIITAFLYCLYFFFLSGKGKRSTLFKAVSVVLAVFFILGWPKYSELLLANQTNSWLSAKAAKLAREYISDNSVSEEITLFIPESFENKEKVELYNGLRVRAFDNTQFINASDVNVANIPTTYGVIITELTETVFPEEWGDNYIEFNDRRFALEVVTR